MHATKFDITPYLNLALRRKWWIIIPFVLTVLAGTGFLVISPKTYQATTLILLEPQSIPDSFVRSTVVEGVDATLSTIKQQIESRTNLEKIIRDFQLAQVESKGKVFELIMKVKNFFPKINKEKEHTTEQSEGSERIKMMALVDEVRKCLHVNMRSDAPGSGMRGGRNQPIAFEISFEWHNPEIVAPVTNAVAARFIQDNLNQREEIAIGTTDFLEKETAVIRVELEKKEEELEGFKRQHMGMLPDQIVSNNNILSQLREELANLERRLETEQQQIMFLRSQAETARLNREIMRAPVLPEGGRTTVGSRHEQQSAAGLFTSDNVEVLETELARLATLYTEKHPDIIALKHRIENLREKGKQVVTTPQEMGSRTIDNTLGLQLATANANIESYKKEILQVQEQIEMYKQRVERTPQVEMELNKIMRDYQTVRERYDNLLSKKLDAKLAEQMEKRKKGEQFRVLDPAVKPTKPSKPDLPRIMLVVVAAGLGFGCSLAYLREVLDPHFYNPEEISAYLDVKVIVSLPMADVNGNN